MVQYANIVGGQNDDHDDDDDNDGDDDFSVSGMGLISFTCQHGQTFHQQELHRQAKSKNVAAQAAIINKTSEASLAAAV